MSRSPHLRVVAKGIPERYRFNWRRIFGFGFGVGDLRLAPSSFAHHLTGSGIYAGQVVREGLPKLQTE